MMSKAAGSLWLQHTKKTHQRVVEAESANVVRRDVAVRKRLRDLGHDATLVWKTDSDGVRVKKRRNGWITVNLLSTGENK